MISRYLKENDLVNLVSVIDKSLYVMYYYNLDSKNRFIRDINNFNNNLLVNIIFINYDSKLDLLTLRCLVKDSISFSLVIKNEFVSRFKFKRHISFELDFEDKDLLSFSNNKIFEVGSRRANILNWICKELFGKELTSYQYKNILRKGRERLRDTSI